MFDCERPGCGHPLAVHDPCYAVVATDDDTGEPILCDCDAFVPADRKARVARLTNTDQDETDALLREAARQ